jgi:hypothetical protein
MNNQKQFRMTGKDMNRDQKVSKKSYTKTLVRQELLLQLGIAEMQKDILVENNHLDFNSILNLIEQKKSAIKSAFKYYSEGDNLLYKVHLNHSILIEDEIKTQLETE